MTIIKKTYLVVILFIGTTGGHLIAGGDDGLLDENELAPADQLLEQTITIKPPSEIDQNVAWLKEQEKRAKTITFLQYQADIARLQEEIAIARKACIDAGYGCPLIDDKYLSPPDGVDTNNVYYPNIAGVHAGMVGVEQEGNTYWLSPGDSFMGITAKEIGIDEVVFETSFGEEIRAAVRQREIQ